MLRPSNFDDLAAIFHERDIIAHLRAFGRPKQIIDRVNDLAR